MTKIYSNSNNILLHLKIYSKNNKGSLSSLIVYKDGSIKKYLIQDKKYFTAITIRFYFFRLYRNFYKLYLIIIN
jgi:hypothetical protein